MTVMSLLITITYGKYDDRRKSDLDLKAMTHQYGGPSSNVGLSVSVCQSSFSHVCHTVATNRTPIGSFSADTA